MSDPGHIGSIIARAFKDVQRQIENGEVRAHERCICNPHARLLKLAPNIFVTEFAHDSWCPVIGGNGKAS
jgi:hypothetical protein